MGAAAAGGAVALAAPSSASAATEPDVSSYLVGRGIADSTGPAAENGLMGYSKPGQSSTGIQQRLRTRAFVIVDQASGNRVAWCVGDHAMVPVAAHGAIVQRLSARFPGMYDATNICVTATHTHASPGGCSHDLFYNLTLLGFQEQTFDALVDGYVEAIAAAHADLKPGSLSIGRTTLTNASVNRSKRAFDLNPQADKDHFPDGIDPNMTVLRFKQGAKDVGTISWFPVHSTSLPNTNTLVSGDNKGYAAYSWERGDLGQDYLGGGPGFVAAFAQAAAGDMSPNLNLKPGSGPTEDPVKNMQIIGDRQKDAAKRAWSHADTPVTGSISSIARYVDLANTIVAPEYAPDGKEHHTVSGTIGPAMLAGSTEDGPGLGYPEGWPDILAPFWKVLNQTVPTWLEQAQSPKVSLIPVGLIGAMPNKAMIQVIKLGQIYLACQPGEMTVVAGLRVRRAVAAAVGAPLENVLIQTYTNGYTSYSATPEEYDQQDYEGGHTLYGRYTTCMYAQELSRLGNALRAGQTVPLGSAGAPSPLGFLNLQPGVVYDNPPLFKKFGDVVTEPSASYGRGAKVTAVFVTGHPKNDLRLGGTYIEVQRQVAGGLWKRVHDDGDHSATFSWKRTNVLTGESNAVVTWDIPAETKAGTYRIVHHGAAKAPLIGTISKFTGTSRTFAVS
ncbi:neutral/alkaline nonlysosomal ceramidase [Luteipulveratus mongoliensis]|uniref:Neutral ceramidase n=2 Tax=Luteipulveratus mongoliensis TaxID=571913 RepID=A0A0K1JFI8_9MICO|nr:neutral/alkaline nonlysosomal ceramidase [Luteipulveratus mongoliensis]